ncbi:MAG TPA: hypothetical protein VL346_03460 [Acidobacteriaceae bacterium]|nr:hypothetical protein [Acidobacteriaceae bacterium]
MPDMLPSLRSTRWALLAALILLPLCACKSYWVETTIENQTGNTVHEVEVDYPSASFGVNALASGASMHYHFKIQGSGPIKVQYLLEDGKTISAQGPTLAERQQGSLTLRLLPAGKVDFLPNLNSGS